MRRPRGTERPRSRTRRAAPLLLAAAAASAVAGCGGERASHPSVLLVTIDTLRADHLHSYGFELETSPHLDALAARGVLFERAIAAAPATSPSHASIMTSRYPRGHTVGHGNGTTRLDRDPTLAEAFRDAGYRTAAFVGNLVLDRRTGFDRGFELYDDEFEQRVAPGSFERIAERTTARALSWLDSIGDDPYFLWVHYQDPHGPYTPPAGYEGRFRVEADPDESPLPPVSDSSDRGGIPEYQLLEGLTRPSEYRSRYADEIFYADVWIGRLLEAVDSASRDPIVLVTADHGEAMGEHDRYFVHFWTSTPENAHVPMILRAPGIEPSRRGRVVSHVDVMPTLLELAGVEPPPDLRGVALGPFLRGSQPLPSRVVYCDAGHELTAYRSRSFVRVLDTPSFHTASAPARPKPAVVGIGYRWSDGGDWAAVRRNVALSPEVAHYTATLGEVSPAPLLDARTRARLRALGYELPSGTPEAPTPSPPPDRAP